MSTIYINRLGLNKQKTQNEELVDRVIVYSTSPAHGLIIGGLFQHRDLITND